MSKYIIELGEDANMVQVISVTQSGNAYIDSTVYVGYLEQLTADYINEHFGGLQDQAYQKGFEDGKKFSVGEAVKRAEYDKGLEDAWECAKKLYLNGLSKELFGRYFSAFIQEYSARQAIEMLKAHEQKKDDKIDVGDEVNWLCDCFIVTRIFQPRNGKEQCDGIDDDGCVYHDVLMDDLEKTGRHFDISKILEEMKHD